MTTIDAIGHVKDGELVVKLKHKIPSGEHRVFIIVEDEHELENIDLPTIKVGSWPKSLSLNRENIYSDDGR